MPFLARRDQAFGQILAQHLAVGEAGQCVEVRQAMNVGLGLLLFRNIQPGADNPRRLMRAGRQHFPFIAHPAVATGFMRDAIMANHPFAVQDAADGEPGRAEILGMDIFFPPVRQQRLRQAVAEQALKILGYLNRAPVLTVMLQREEHGWAGCEEAPEPGFRLALLL